jgi:simple sugar transport system permease protein
VNVPRVIAGAFLTLLGMYLFYHAWTYVGKEAGGGQIWYGASIMAGCLGIALLFDRSAEAVAIPALAVGASLVIFTLYLWFSKSVSPIQVVGTMYKAAFGSSFAFQNTLLRASPLMLTGLCTALPRRVGLVIIGGEGALVIGALVSAGVGHAVEVSGGTPWMVISSMLATGFLAGGAWIGLVGVLKHFRGVNETISSLLMIYIAIALLNHMCEGPWHDPTSLNTPSTWTLDPNNQIKNLDFSDSDFLAAHPGAFWQKLSFISLDGVHWGLVYGVVACIICYLLVNHTATGFAGRVVGGNLKAARVGGISLGKTLLLFCAVGGGAAGLAGAVQVSAVAGKCNASIYSDGYGYTGILVASLAKHNPLAIIPVAILIGGIGASDTLLQSDLNLPAATSLVLQGIIFVILLGSESFYGKIPFLRARGLANG